MRGPVDVVVGIEARGFILGAAVAYQLGIGFVPVRKSGKLPGPSLREEYTLEYGSAVLEMHEDALQPGQRVLVVDDVLATGGTVAATCRLVERAGATVAGIDVRPRADLPERPRHGRRPTAVRHRAALSLTPIGRQGPVIRTPARIRARGDDQPPTRLSS